jgi:hypothetical protein
MEEDAPPEIEWLSGIGSVSPGKEENVPGAMRVLIISPALHGGSSGAVEDNVPIPSK